MPGELYSEHRYAKLKFDIVFTWIKFRLTTITPNGVLVTQLVWPSVYTTCYRIHGFPQ